jgi:hypothetical protein
MATSAQWANGYARQADADFRTFEKTQDISVPECHKLLFLQMTCEKLVKAYLCGMKTDPAIVQTSHAYIAKSLPVVLRQQAVHFNYSGKKAAEALGFASRLAQEIELLAPAVRRGGQRPDNCEYPWEDGQGKLHLPLDWSFHPSQLVVMPAGRTVLKLIRGAIDRLLQLEASGPSPS